MSPVPRRHPDGLIPHVDDLLDACARSERAMGYRAATGPLWLAVSAGLRFGALTQACIRRMRWGIFTPVNDAVGSREERGSKP